MGKFSGMQTEETVREDTSYPSFEMQLRWTAEDLELKVEKLLHGRDDFFELPDVLCELADVRERLDALNRRDAFAHSRMF